MTARSCLLIALGALLIAGATSIPIPAQADCAPAIINTVVGGGVGDGVLATQGFLNWPRKMAVSGDGSLYIADSMNGRVRRVDPAGIITTVAGGGPTRDLGDGGRASEASLWCPEGVALGPGGVVYIADTDHHRVRRVDPTGVITTAAGDGCCSGHEGRFTGDGGPAILASLDHPSDVAVGPDGCLYIADARNQRIRKVDAAGIITTVVGSGRAGWDGGGYSGDGGPATAARLNWPSAIAFGGDGSLHICDWGNRRIRKVDAAGIITTIAGNGQWGYSGDGGPATQAGMSPRDVALDAAGRVCIVDSPRIRRVDLAGIITTVAGNGQSRHSGDGGPATAAGLDHPEGMAVGPDGTIYIAEFIGFIRKVDPAGMISTVAGTGESQYGGDGGPAMEAALHCPMDVAQGLDGTVYIADKYNYRVRRVDPSGTITTVAGNGESGYSGDGGPAVAARLSSPQGVAAGAGGTIYIADTPNHRVRRVDAAGIITTVAGSGPVGEGKGGYSGDGGPATQARLWAPNGLALAEDGSLYLADSGNHRIRKIDPAGIITTVAGNGESGYSGDGGPAVAARLSSPQGVATGADGSLYIADLGNYCIRKVHPSGIITTVAGSGQWGFSGDGGPALQARFEGPGGVAIGLDGALYIADTNSNRIRKVNLAGIITTLAGNGRPAFSGDGGPASAAMLQWPKRVAIAADGNLLIADSGNCRVRKVTFGSCCAPAYEPESPQVGDVVTFHANASASGWAPICQWDFGDGARAGGCDATHVYSSPGAYLACVTVSDIESASHTCCTPVTVTCECDVGLIPFWCRMPSGRVGQTKRGQIAAWNRAERACEVVLRVTNGAGGVVFETTRTLLPFRWVQVNFRHTFTPQDAGRSLWTWEVWPVECSERTPRNNVLQRRVNVTMPRR